jgi:Ulp1 family protease
MKYHSFRQYINKRFHKETGEYFKWNNWKRNCHEDAPRQQNSYDCGIFAIKVSK